MRHHDSVASFESHLDCIERFRQRTDLVDLHQNGIGAAMFDAVGEPGDVGDEQIVANQLALAADQIGQFLPALHVIFGHAVLD